VLKERINGALAAMTGYQLRRVESGPPPAEPAPPPPPPSPQPATEQAGQQASAPAKPKPKKGNLPGHYDAASKQVIRRVKPRTMTSPEKLYGLIMATRYINAHGIPGDIVECGVWRGGSMQAAALTLLEAGADDRDLHLFDTFEGMPPPTEHDKRPGGRTAEEMLRTSDRDAKIWAVATLDDVRTAMEETEYPAERIHYHPGMVEETIPRDAPERISILRLDTDWYESTRHELEHLYDRLSPGGVLIIDDYGGWEGSRKATEEFLAKTNAPLLLLPISAGRIAVKPNI
jgi:O-methyltransferase